MIKFVTGNFFDYEANIRVNTVNCVGIMGAGVALLFKNKFPEMFKEYSIACKNKEVIPGKPHIWEGEDMFSKFTIINFPTKIHWQDPSEYDYIEKGLIWMREYLLNDIKSTVTMPALGCGHGGLDWVKVKQMIIKYLGDLNSNILVFEPNSSTNKSLNVQENKILEEKDIKRLFPSDMYYPEKLKGRSSLELFYQGNIELFARKKISIIVNSKPEEREKKALIAFIEELPNDDFVFLLGFNNNYEIDLAKEVLLKGFKVIIVIPYGILHLKIRTDLTNILDYNNVALVSITTPDQIMKGYSSLNAFKFRVKVTDILLINALNYDRFINLENDLNLPNCKIFYLNYWSSKVDFFDRLSAIKIGLNPNTMKPNTKQLINSLR
jgi:O-acetyl-ADP-ribose deacetylase (regulator of RNase III)